jgi:hypothetical protein
MRLGRQAEPIRRRQEEPSPRLEDSMRLGKGGRLVPHVLDDVAADQAAEALRGERLPLRAPADQADVGMPFLVEPLPGEQEPAQRDIDPTQGPLVLESIQVGRAPCQREQNRTCPTPEVEDPVPRNQATEGDAPVEVLREPLGTRQDVGDLPAAQVGGDLGREVEVALEESAEVQPVVVFVQPEGKFPVRAVGQEKVVVGPEVGDPPKTTIDRSASQARPPVVPGLQFALTAWAHDLVGSVHWQPPILRAAIILRRSGGEWYPCLSNGGTRE